MLRQLIVVAVAFVSGPVLVAGDKEAPRVVPPQQAGVGRLVSDFSAVDVGGNAVRLAEVGKGRQAVVVAVTSTSCPISLKYLPTLAKLEKEFAAKGVAFVYLNPISTDSPDKIRTLIATHGLKGSYIHDKDGVVAKEIGATSTGDFFLLRTKILLL